MADFGGSGTLTLDVDMTDANAVAAKLVHVVAQLDRALERMEDLAPLLEKVDGRIGALRLQPGDVLVFKANRNFTHEFDDGFRAALTEHLPEGVEILLLTPDIDLVDVKVISRSGDGENEPAPEGGE